MDAMVADSDRALKWVPQGLGLCAHSAACGNQPGSAASHAPPPTAARHSPPVQWIDKEDDIQAAIEACPVSCIHWVTKDDLPALEFVTQNKVCLRWPRQLLCG